MYEEYPMIHYEFGRPETDFSLIAENEIDITETERSAWSLVRNADYNLRGYVDVLPFFPQPDDLFHKQMHLQSFSHMYSLKDYYTSRHDTDSWLLVWTNGGHGRLEYRGASLLLEEGDLFWIDCRERNSYFTEGEFWEHTDIHINGSGIEPLYRRFDGRSPHIRADRIPFFRNDLKALLDAATAMDANRTLLSAHAIETMLVHLITAESENGRNGSGEPKLQSLIRYIHEHFREPLTMDQLSGQAGFSKYHMSREFKKLTGLPPNEYLIRLRIEQAKRLLVNTDLPVYRVGLLSGIENEAYFSRLFHQRLQMTPAEFRKKNRTV